MPTFFTDQSETILASYPEIKWATRRSEIKNTDGTIVFAMNDISVPEQWSQVAVDILAQKYFRKAGVPSDTIPVEEEGIPVWAQRRIPAPGAHIGGETSASQVFSRMAKCWSYWGIKSGLLDHKEALVFHDNLVYMLASQMCAPNSPQWFNTGLYHAYGIDGPAQGHYYVDETNGALVASTSSYARPQPSACFIQSVSDDLVNEGGIMDLWVREARLFKYGSGAGTNFSSLRAEGEPLSGGGRSSGLMSWLKIGDRAAGAIKSGGTTRRAAKMVCLDMDHPDIEAFIQWKVTEEQKVAALVTGSIVIQKALSEIVNAGAQNQEAIRKARKSGVPENYIMRVLQLVRQGVKQIEFDTYTTDWDGAAYGTVAGQNSNNSVRIPDSFMEAVAQNGDWHLRRRTDGKITKTIPARDLWDTVATAAWACADPGIQFDSTINDWHTCPKDGRINASNPCVTGDTLVSTSVGVRHIADLLTDNTSVIGADGISHPIAPAFPTGRKPIYQLRTKAGYGLKLTADHRVLTTNRGDVAACDLTVKDQIKLGSVAFGQGSVDSRIGEFLGLMIGDGCLMGEQETAMVTLAPDAEAVAVSVCARLNDYKKEYGLDKRESRENKVNSPQGTFRVGTAARCVVDMVKRYTIVSQGSQGKQFTDEIFNLGRASVREILRGVFTSDGTVANYGDKSQYISLDSTSLVLLEQVQLLLLGFGIKAKIYTDRKKCATSMLPDGKGGKKEEEFTFPPLS